MELLSQLIDIVLHLDKHVLSLATNYGTWVYVILFAIVFMETGFVFTPFLPGDSLLFVSGAVAATGGIDPWFIGTTLIFAALSGDNVNYWVGRFLGKRIFQFEHSRFLKQENLNRTHEFMEKHGPKAIVMARFVPIVRTFVPFVCGIGRMTYLRFFGYSCLGALLWIGTLVPLGYFFGNLPIVKNNLSIAILGIVLLSLLPGLMEIFNHHAHKKGSQA